LDNNQQEDSNNHLNRARDNICRYTHQNQQLNHREIFSLAKFFIDLHLSNGGGILPFIHDD